MLCKLERELRIIDSSESYHLLAYNIVHKYIRTYTRTCACAHAHARAHTHTHTGSGMQEKNALMPHLHHPLKMNTSIP
jgi:hypothetical protein